MTNISSINVSSVISRAINYSTLAGSTIITNSITTNSTLTGSTLTLSGNVGIGTTNPGAILHTYGSNPTLLLQTSTVGYGSGSATIQFITSTANYPLAQIKAIDMGVNPAVFRGDLVFYSQFNTTLNEAMRIQNGGNVGIGTASPGYTLAINGTLGLVHTGLTNTNQIQFNNSTTTYTIQQVDNAGANYLRLGRNGFGDIVINSAGSVGIGITTYANHRVTVYQDGNSSLNEGAMHSMSILSNQGTGAGQNQMIMLLDADYTNQCCAIQSVVLNTKVWNLCLNPRGGNVGIGTTNPGTALDVNGTILIRGANFMQFLNGSNNYIYATTHDGYTPASLNNNLIIKSWHGIAFATHDNSVRVTIDTRTGNANFSGSITAGIFLGDGLPIPCWTAYINGWYIKNPNTRTITIYGTAISSDWSYIYLNLWDLTGIRTIAYPFDEYNFVSTFQRVPIGFAPPINNANEVRIDSNQGNASKYGITFIIKASY
jgi:hypothetical protein